MPKDLRKGTRMFSECSERHWKYDDLQENIEKYADVQGIGKYGNLQECTGRYEDIQEDNDDDVEREIGKHLHIIGSN